MSEVRNYARFAYWPLPVALLCVMNIGTSRAQEIRVLAEANQSIQMTRGGYICEGRLTYTPADSNVDLETVQCTGRIYNSQDYQALQAKLNHDEMVKLNDAVNRLSQEILDRQAQQLKRDLKTNIEERFQALPHGVLASEDVQNLKKSLLEYIDLRVSLEASPSRSRQRPAPSGENSPPPQP